MPVGTTRRVAPGSALLAGLVAVLLGAGVAGAPTAAAVDDPSRPDARVTHGPSCRPGGVVVEVIAGAVPYSVVLASTRKPAGEASAEVEPGATVVLETGPVDWGETIDTHLEYTARDGSGTRYTDDLSGYSFTRPAQEDCAVIAPPTAPATVPPGAPVPDGAHPAGVPPVVTVPDTTTEVVPMPVPGLPAPSSGSTAAVPGGTATATSSEQQVLAGDVVTLTGAGFQPGEPITVLVNGTAVPVTVTAGSDGTVTAEVPVPDGVLVGDATVELVGAHSSLTAMLELQVAARGTPVARDEVSWPLLTAGVALLAAAAGLVVTAGRRTPPRARARIGSA